MSAPGLELKWSGDTWHRSHRRQVQPIMGLVLELAREGLEHLNVELSETKRVAVYRVGKTWDDVGMCAGHDRLELYVHADDIKRHRVAAKTGQLAVVAVHELLHSIRYEYSDLESIAENAASEGLAVIGADMFASALLFDDEYRRLSEEVRAIPETLAQQVHQSFMDMPGLFTSPADEVLFDNLFGDQAIGNTLPDGYVAGIYSVAQHLQNGMRLSEVIRLPTEEILRIG